jgi:hypothetical protein
MKAKALTTSAANVLLQFRDKIKAEQQALEQKLEQKNILHKAETHEMKLEIKRLGKEADHLQALVSEETLAELVAKKNLEEQYRFKTQSDLELALREVL